jgi:hypothetical protein
MVFRLSATVVPALITMLALPVSTFAVAEKVDLCHATGSASNPFEVISVADSAFPAHQAHGDFVVPGSGDCSDGVPA